MESNSTIVIPDAPKGVYEQIRGQIKLMENAVPGIIVTCTQVENDALRITLVLDKDTPQKYRDAVERFAATVAEKIKQALDESLPTPRPLVQEVSVREKRVNPTGNNIERRSQHALIRVNTPRIVGNPEERQERMKLQGIFCKAEDKIKKHLMGNKIHMKITNLLDGSSKDFLQTFINVDEDRAEEAGRFLEGFVAANGETIDEEYSLILEPATGEKSQFNLKLKKKSIPPNSTSS